MRWPAPRIPVSVLLAEPRAAVAVVDRGLRVVQANAAFTALAGPGAIVPLGAAAAREVAQALREAAALTIETSLPDGDGSMPVCLSVVPLGRRGGKGLLRMTDLRPLRQLQAQLRQAQRLQSVGQLAAGIAHDFNNLLTAVIGAAEALGPAVAAGGQDDLAQIRSSAERGAALVRQLLAYGGEQTLQPRVLNLNDAIRDVAALLRRLLGARVTLEIALDEPGRRVLLDPTQLDQVLVNLAVNARDAMPDGGTVTISTGRRLLLAAETEDGQTLPAGRYATVEVRDTGVGIGPDVLPHIFDPFFTTRREAGGTGLGLSTVQGIVRQSGGTLSVRSAPGAGSCFRITLPRHETPLAVAETAALVAPPARAGGRLLLVEDEAPVRLLAARALTRAGWDVVQAETAEDALALETGGIAQIVSDVIMPGMDGPTLVRTLRRDAPGLKATLISGYANAAQRRALQAEDIGFLSKPFRMAELVSLTGAPCPRN